MPSYLRIHFNNLYHIDLKRVDPMRPMDLGDGPEVLELDVTALMGYSETTWNPLFGTQTLYTGSLYDGEGGSRPVFIKWARSKGRMGELEREGNLYCSALRRLQGLVAPNFYGYYMAVDRQLLGVGCMILENVDEGDILSDEIDDRSKLEAAYRLHKAGIRHCGFHDKKTFVANEDKVCIVGFSKAERCGCEMTRDRVRLCPEMMWMEQQFGDGEASSVLKELGVPPGWRECLFEAAKMAGWKPY